MRETYKVSKNLIGLNSGITTNKKAASFLERSGLYDHALKVSSGEIRS